MISKLKSWAIEIIKLKLKPKEKQNLKYLHKTWVYKMQWTNLKYNKVKILEVNKSVIKIMMAWSDYNKWLLLWHIEDTEINILRNTWTLAQKQV